MGGNAQVNPDLKTGKGYEDSVYFTTGVDLINFEEKGYMTIRFSKKYNKNQLTKNFLNLYALPENEKNDFYSARKYPFAVDYERSNTMDGVALTFRTYTKEGYLRYYQTYSPAPRGLATSVTNDVQKNSTFEIIKVYSLPDGRKFVEAKFQAKVFGEFFNNPSSGPSEEAKSVENGYILFQVRMF